MISEKERRALQYCDGEWRYLWDRAPRVGVPAIHKLAAKGLVSLELPEGKDELCYRETEAGRAARIAFFRKFGEVWRG